MALSRAPGALFRHICEGTVKVGRTCPARARREVPRGKWRVLSNCHDGDAEFAHQRLTRKSDIAYANFVRSVGSGVKGFVLWRVEMTKRCRCAFVAAVRLVCSRKAHRGAGGGIAAKLGLTESQPYSLCIGTPSRNCGSKSTMKGVPVSGLARLELVRMTSCMDRGPRGPD